MDKVNGWLFDLYEHPEHGLVLWVIADSGERLRLRMEFPTVFYVAGDFPLLRQAWVFLRKESTKLERVTRRDLFIGDREVMQVTLHKKSSLIHELQRQFPSLDYYDADIPIALRFIAETDVHLLGRCRVILNGEWVKTIEPLDSPWQLSPNRIPLRIMELAPDADPAFRAPTRLKVRYEAVEYVMNIEPHRALLISLQADLRRFDPDLILTRHGDPWLIPMLIQWSQETGLGLDLNRDKHCNVLQKKANSYFTYGQVVHRRAQSHLFGRWHIDRKNAMLFSEYELEGVFEQARVTGIGVQEMARKSPGAGITAMQMQTALKNKVMVPLHKQQAEDRKSLAELIRADKGGLVYQPLIGVHKDVAQIDFSSMYPGIMVHYNVSPETIHKTNPEEGLIPKTLKPLLEKRLAIKKLLTELDLRDCEIPVLKQRSDALKWLLVVCFGYLGYKNARFGKIESHETVTAISRELMLQAKEIAEDMGFDVLHMYVDSLFVRKDGLKNKSDFDTLLKMIAEQTRIPIALEGIYRWVTFLPSRRDKRVPVPNRYFGVFQNGDVKYRGIEARRRDTPYWVRKIQLEVLDILAKAEALEEIPTWLPYTSDHVARAKRDLRNGNIPLEELVITQSLSRPVEEYKVPSPAAQAGMQLQLAGKLVAPGQFMRFVYVYGKERVRAWELGVDPRTVDMKRYCLLLDRAVTTVIEEIKTESQSFFL